MVRLADGRVAAKAYLQGAKGVALFETYTGPHGGTPLYVWVYDIYLPKGMNTWAARNGRKFFNVWMGEQHFADRVTDFLPPDSCEECGYEYTDLEEGCDTCAPKKQEPETPGRVYQRQPKKGSPT
jgi:hypothetical protein